MKVRPLHDRIIVRRVEEGEQRIGGIIIPDTAKEKPMQGEVVAAGNGKVRDDGKVVPMGVTTGDVILFGKYSGQEIKLDGEELLIMREDEVLGVIEGKSSKKKKKSQGVKWVRDYAQPNYLTLNHYLPSGVQSWQSRSSTVRSRGRQSYAALTLSPTPSK